MKTLHRPDLFCWSAFDESRNIDFHSYLWTSEGGNVAVDPLPMSQHDLAHLKSLGPLAIIVVTNSDHVRATAALVAATGAKVAGPAGERLAFPLPCDRWLEDGEMVVAGCQALALSGSKTPGELALVVDGTVLITGDLVRATRAGTLARLPDAKLADRDAALASLRRLSTLPGIEAVLVGDGWPVFSDGARHLSTLSAGQPFH